MLFMHVQFYYLVYVNIPLQTFLFAIINYCFIMTNTQQKIIIKDLIGNIHTVLSIYVVNFENYNNIICYLVAIRS